MPTNSAFSIITLVIRDRGYGIAEVFLQHLEKIGVVLHIAF